MQSGGGFINKRNDCKSKYLFILNISDICKAINIMRYSFFFFFFN